MTVAPYAYFSLSLCYCLTTYGACAVRSVRLRAMLCQNKRNLFENFISQFSLLSSSRCQIWRQIRDQRLLEPTRPNFHNTFISDFRNLSTINLPVYDTAAQVKRDKAKKIPEQRGMAVFSLCDVHFLFLSFASCPIATKHAATAETQQIRKWCIVLA